jgi:hypothetical protein
MSAHLSDEQRDLVAKGLSDSAHDVHLASCIACRTAVRSAKGRQTMLQGLRPYTLSDIAFRRVEARLMEQVEAGLPSPWPSWPRFFVPAAIAAGVLLAVVSWKRAPVVETVPVATLRPLPKPFEPMVATYASADAKVRRSESDWKRLFAGDEVTSGAAISASRLTLVAISGLVFEADGSFAVGGQAMVVVGAGSVAASGNAEVLAGSRRMTSVEAIYRVERTASEVVLDVASGEVTVFDDGVHRSVRGPTRVRWADGTALESGVTEAHVGFGAPVGVKLPAVRLELGALPDGTLLSIDDLSFGATPFSFMLEAGRHRVQLTPPGQPTQERFVDLVGGQPFALALAAPSERTLEAPAPDAQALAQVMEDLRRQTPKLRSCYEKWLKANPNASGQVDLVLVVSAKGVVKRTEVRGEAISVESAMCLKTVAKTLVLSPLGSEQELELPLVLTTGKR